MISATMPKIKKHPRLDKIYDKQVPHSFVSCGL